MRENMSKKKETLYNKVYNDLIAKIQSGKLKVGEKLPTEMELTEIYGVSRITVSHALKNLADANLVYRVKRSGTFVNGKLNRNAPLIVPVILPFVEDLNEIMTGIQNTALSFNTPGQFPRPLAWLQQTGSGRLFFFSNGRPFRDHRK